MIRMMSVSYTLRGVDHSAITTEAVARMVAADLARRYPGVEVKLERA